MRFLLDTNAILYFLHDRLERPLPFGNYYFSIITEIELFSYPHITRSEADNIRQLLAAMTRVELSMQVRDKTIAVRIANRLKLPDAIIAASTLIYDAVLLSNDNGFEKVADLKRQFLKLKTGAN